MPELPMQQEHQLPEHDMMIGKSNAGPGWQGVLQATVDKLNELDCVWAPRQVKEKFGELRFYINADGEQANDAYELVHEAERESSEICYECGEDGKIVSIKGWWLTLCEEHAAEYLKRREESDAAMHAASEARKAQANE